jgi:hypothetical protein
MHSSQRADGGRLAKVTAFAGLYLQTMAGRKLVLCPEGV